MQGEHKAGGNLRGVDNGREERAAASTENG